MQRQHHTEQLPPCQHPRSHSCVWLHPLLSPTHRQHACAGAHGADVEHQHLVLGQLGHLWYEGFKGFRRL